MSETPHISISQIDMLSRCGEQYRRRYVLGEIIPPAVAMLVGGAIDKSVNRNMQHKIDTKGELLSIEECAETARDELNNRWESGVMLDAEEREKGIKAVKGEAVDKSVRLSTLHAGDTAKIIAPTHVQRRCEVDLTGYGVRLLGYIDIQEGHVSVRDTKSSAKTPNKDIAHQSAQLTNYALMVKVLDGKTPEKLILDYLIDTKIPKAQSFESTRHDEDFMALLRRIETMLMALEKGVFVPARETDWWCSERFCGYWHSCPYIRKPKQFAVA